MGRHHHQRKSSSSEEAKGNRSSRKGRKHTQRDERYSNSRAADDSEDSGHSDDSEKQNDRRRHKRARTRQAERDDQDFSRNRKESKKRKDRSRLGSVEEDDKRRRKSSRSEKKKSKHSFSGNHKSVRKIKIDKAQLVALGDIAGKPPAKILDPEDDYFAYHQHLSVYLYREEGVTFGDLNSEDSRIAFRRFCRQYNEGKLEAAYYDEVLPIEAVEECKTTRHKWSFQTNSTEAKMLHLIEEGVRKQTQYDGGPSSSHAVTAISSHRNVTSLEDLPVAPEENAASDYLKERQANKRLREHVRTVEDELMGGPKDGRERLLEKKKVVSATIHGASRDREDAGFELADADLYGDSKGDFAAALARERKHKQKRISEREARLAELQSKEHERQQAMLNALGLTDIKPGQKITIAPRTDSK